MAAVWIVGLLAVLTTVSAASVFENVVEASPVDEGVHWALIVAGSNGWYNYRHQADACHAYQILHQHGIPDERIVVMMYDDLADNSENPTPGIVINHPNGSDVYHDVPKDYTGDDVTPENFLNILQGNEDEMSGIGSGKVIKSGPKDRVFVNFADHGAPGLIAFPSDELHASQLMTAIKNMHRANKYSEMVFYIEACESGSMFENLLPDDINVYATTAANAEESSYACYYDEARDTYLGDVYSVMWMEDSDAEDLSSETLEEQFRIVKQETNTSHVKEYGDLSIAREPVANFQGKRSVAPLPKLPYAPLQAVPAPDVPLAIRYRKLQKATTSEQRQMLIKEIMDIKKVRSQIEQTMQTIILHASPSDAMKAERLFRTKQPINNLDCYEPAVKLFDEVCYDLSEHEYALRVLYGLVNMCEDKDISALAIQDAIRAACE